MTGPKNAESGQYEYIVITNWAKFPLVAMARDLAYFEANYRDELIQSFKNEGYIHEFSELVFFPKFIPSFWINVIPTKSMAFLHISG